MGTAGGPKLVTRGLKFYIDSSNPRSYISGSTDWNDLMQKEYHMNINAGESVNTSSANTPVLFFDGAQNSYSTWSGDKLTSPAIFNNNSFTYTVVAYPTSLAGIDNPGYVRTMESGGWPNSYILCQWNSGSKQITFGGEDDNQENFGLGTGTNSIDINKWWFSTFTIDRDNNLETGYLNGEQVQQNSFSETFQGVNPTGSFRIPSSWTEYPGGIALTLMYEVALTATEVKQNYNALKGRFRL
tara:strand:- start:329 stop:1054 length:726 start_codon:yes stop_codon:yes gene_type:complete